MGVAQDLRSWETALIFARFSWLIAISIACFAPAAAQDEPSTSRFCTQLEDLIGGLPDRFEGFRGEAVTTRDDGNFKTWTVESVLEGFAKCFFAHPSRRNIARFGHVSTVVCHTNPDDDADAVQGFDFLSSQVAECLPDWGMKNVAPHAGSDAVREHEFSPNNVLLYPAGTFLDLRQWPPERAPFGRVTMTVRETRIGVESLIP